MTVNVLEFEKHGFAQFCAEMGEKPFRARQLMRWIHQYGVDNFDAMTDISKPLRERLSIAAEVRAPRVVRATTAADGTRKWLLDVGTGNAIETVLSRSAAAARCVFRRRRVARSNARSARPAGRVSTAI